MDPDVLLSPASVSFRFHEILKTLAESDEGKLHILKVVYEVWRNHPQVKTCVCVCQVCVGPEQSTCDLSAVSCLS